MLDFVWLQRGSCPALYAYDGTAWQLSADMLGIEAVYGPIRDIDGSSADHVWALGLTTLLRFDGEKWSKAPWPLAPLGSARLISVNVVSRDEVWISGWEWLASRYDGAKWHNLPIPGNYSYMKDYMDIGGSLAEGLWVADGWCSSLGQCKDVGTIRYFDGSSWSEAIASAGRILVRLFELDQERWAVGSAGTILHQKDGVWQQLDSSSRGSLRAIWAAGPDAIWVAGDRDMVSHPKESLILRFDGASWSQAQAIEGSLNGLWGTGESDIWAVGGSSIRHFNGESWSATDLEEGWELTAIWGSGPRDIWVVARAAAGDTCPIMHFDGESWVVHQDSLCKIALKAVWGSSAENVWAVGESKQLLHWDGQSWTTATLTPEIQDKGFSAVWGSSADDVWAGGSEGSLVHYDGESWVLHRFLGDHVFAIHGTGPSDVWALCLVNSESDRYAITYHFNGSVWTRREMNHAPRLHALFAIGPDDVWAAGDNGSLLHFDDR